MRPKEPVGIMMNDSTNNLPDPISSNMNNNSNNNNNNNNNSRRLRRWTDREREPPPATTQTTTTSTTSTSHHHQRFQAALSKKRSKSQTRPYQRERYEEARSKSRGRTRQEGPDQRRPNSTGRANVLSSQSSVWARHRDPEPSTGPPPIVLTVTSDSNTTATTATTSRSKQKQQQQEESAAFTQSILDLRERREQSRRYREKLRPSSSSSSYPSVDRQNSNVTASTCNSNGRQSTCTPPPPQQQQQKNSQDIWHHRSQSFESTDKYLHEEERVAQKRLKNAENRIGNLMQELEDLRFFHEIDMEPASPNPRPPLLPTMSSSSNNGRKSPALPLLHHQTQQQQQPPPPPPPQPQMDVPSRVLSPRRLSGMDRHSLELEAQQLQRQVEILAAEKTSLQATVTMCEQQAKSHEEDASRMRALEQSLHEVRTTISDQLKEFQASRTKVTDQYEAKVEALQNTYKAAKQDNEELATKLNMTKESLQKLEQDLKRSQDQYSSNFKKQAQMWRSKESGLELKLAESTVEIDSLKQSLSEKESESQELKDVLEKATAAMEAMEQEIETEHDKLITELSEQLQQEREKHDELQAKHDELQAKHEEQALELEIRRKDSQKLRKADENGNARLSELQKQFDDLDANYLVKMEELKRTFEMREQRRLDDLVESQHNKNMDYEELLSDTRKQLTLATDRHQKEMEQKEQTFRAMLESDVKAGKEEIRREYQVKLAHLEQQLDELNEKYEDALMHQAESKDRDSTLEWEQQDALRAQVDLLNGKLDRAARDLADRDAKIQDLRELAVGTDDRNKVLQEELETIRLGESRTQEELVEHRTLVAMLRAQKSEKDNEMETLRASADDEIAVLQTKLDQAWQQMQDNTHKSLSENEEQQSKLANLESLLDMTRTDLVSEKSRHAIVEDDLREEVAKVKDKLVASEALLKEKGALIDDLHERLSNTEDDTKLHSELTLLQQELDETRDFLAKEQVLSQEKELRIESLTREQADDREFSLSEMKQLDEKLAELQGRLEEAQEEKTEQLKEIERLKELLEEMEERMNEKEKELSTHEEGISKELQDKEEAHKLAIERLNERVEEMEGSVDEKEKKINEHEEELEKVKTSLRNAVDVSMSRTSESMTLKTRIKELESQLEEYQDPSKDSDLVQHLEMKLAELEQSKEEVSEQMNVISKERIEAVEALEDMIREVQIREEEVESLRELLLRREEELDNAKLIATKAIASAQDMKNRYRERGSDRNTEYRLMIDELNASIEYLSEKNDKLKSRALRLETELHDKNKECVRLRDELKDWHQDKAPFPASSSSTATTTATSSSNVDDPFDGDAFFALGTDPENNRMRDFKLMESGFRLSSSSAPSSENVASEGNIMESMSTNTANFGRTTKWLHHFDSDDKSNGFQVSASERSSEPGASRRAIERDALRKYVRRRYLKHPNQDQPETR